MRSNFLLRKQSTIFIYHNRKRVVKYLFALLLIPLLMSPAYGEETSLKSETGAILEATLDYDNEFKPDELTKLNIKFINPQTQDIQVHVDYRITVSNPDKDKDIFETPELIHTSEGEIKGLKVQFEEEGSYEMDITVEGILFSPITPQSIIIRDITIGGEASAQPTTPAPDNNDTPKGEENGGCLIATAAFGSEMAPQVQQLRELRDNTILKTGSGMAFMTSFNQFYYSFSPAVADLEREHPLFKEVVKMTLTPMLSTLSLLNYVDIDSEEEILGYGIGVILLNLGMYVGLPVVGIVKLVQFRRN